MNQFTHLKVNWWIYNILDLNHVDINCKISILFQKSIFICLFVFNLNFHIFILKLETWKKNDHIIFFSFCDLNPSGYKEIKKKTAP